MEYITTNFHINLMMLKVFFLLEFVIKPIKCNW